MRRVFISIILLIAGGASAPAPAATQLTADSAASRWATRGCTAAGGFVFAYDDAAQDVYVHDGATYALAQASPASNVTDSVFGAGTGAAAGEVIGFWRRDTTHLWSYRRTGVATSLFDVVYTNPYNAAFEANPEGARAADGCLFTMLQMADSAFVTHRHMVKIDPASGTYQAISATGNEPGVVSFRFATSDCDAAWSFDDGGGVVALQYYDGASTTTVDAGPVEASVDAMADGRVVYKKPFAGNPEAHVYDHGTAAITRLSNHGSGAIDFLRTDGRHVSWTWQPDFVSPRHVFLNGGILLSDDQSRLPSSAGASAIDLQLEGGRLLWRDESGALRFYDGTGPTNDGYAEIGTIATTPATTVNHPCLAGSRAYWWGLSNDGGTDSEVFAADVTAPAAGDPPAPMLLRGLPGDGAATFTWDAVLGATSYTLYSASVAGVTSANYASLPGGRRLTGVTAPLVLSGLPNNDTLYAVITSSIGASEGPNSHEARVTPVPAWTVAPSAGTLPFYAVAADPAEPRALYAGGTGAMKSTDGGATWTALAGGIEARLVRALAVTAGSVVAATRDGDLLRSIDGGANWTTVADGSDIGENNKSLLVDPANAQVLYAGDFQLPGWVAGVDSYVVRSADGGQSWAHVAEAPGGEIRAYALALDSGAGALYAGGTGTPQIAKSLDGGALWTAASIPGINYVYALADEPGTSNTLWAGTAAFGTSGIHETANGGASWTAKNAGLPLPLPQVHALIADPQQPQAIYAGTSVGFFVSRDGGERWREHSAGLPAGYRWIYGMALSGTPVRSLVAATDGGLATLDLHFCNRYYGDLDADDSVDAVDLVALANHLVGNLAQGDPPFTAPAAAADLNGSGTIDAVDLVVLANALVGNIVCLPV